MKKKQIGLYGGTFDPIHFGHINLAITIAEARSLDEIWFCPAWINPHKLNLQPTPVAHRLKMLELALSDLPGSRLFDYETRQTGPSYTIDTLKMLLATEKNKDFSLILGDDAIPGFFTWKDPHEIVKLVPLLIGSRSPVPIDLSRLQGDKIICKAIEKGITKTAVMEICSTDLRQRLANRLYCGHLIPAKVLDYISSHQLYCSI